MFEKILERVLLTYFGKFITGFDKTNLSLGVWSGNIVIENVSLKPEIIALLEMPLSLKFSSLGRMTLKVPWNKLSSSPVEVTLEDILIVVTPLPEARWQYDDTLQLQRKLASLQKIVQKHLKTKETAEQKSYVDRLTIKIVDNLQVQLKNIHFRFEEVFDQAPAQSYSWGIKLDLLEAMTTNDDFHVCFIDRSDAKNKNAPRNKLIQLKNLQFYWNLHEILFLSEFTPSQQLITDEVIRISAYCKVVLNAQEVLDKPLYILTMDLDSINVNLKHSQLKQMIRVLELISNYSRFRRRVKPASQNSEHYQSEFIDLFYRFNRLDCKELRLFENSSQLCEILESVDQPILADWTKQVVKQLLLDQKASQNKRAKKGWFGFFKQADAEVSEQEVQQIEEQLLESSEQKVVRPQETLKIRFQLKLQGALISLVKDNASLADEALLQSLSKVAIEWDQKENKDFNFRVGIQSIGLQLRKENLEQICKPTFESAEFLRFQISKNTLEQVSRLHIEFLMQSLSCNYNPDVVRIIREIGRVKQGERVESTLKSATWNKLEQIQDQTQSKLRKMLESAVEFSIDAKILKPVLILPFTRAFNSECWLLKMESLQFKSRTKQEEPHESFDLVLLNGCFEYHPDSMNQNILGVVQNYSARVEITRLKNSKLHLMKQENKPLLTVKGRFEPFVMVLNEKVYKDMIYLPETIFPKMNQQQTLQELQQEKLLILKNKSRAGYLMRCGTLIRSWTKNYAVLSGIDIFFYDQEQTLMANSKLSVYNSHVCRLIVDDQLYAFKITNRQGEYVFACENDLELEEWIIALNRQIEEFSVYDESRKLQLKERKEQDYYMELSLQIKKIQVKIYKDTQYPSTYQEYLLFLFKVNSLNYNYSKFANVESNIIVESLSLQDWVFDYENPQFQDLVVISALDQGQSLAIRIANNVITAKVDQLSLNWKPDSFLKIRELLLIIKNRKSRKWYFANIRDYEVEHLKRGSNYDHEEVKKQKMIDGLNRDAIKCMRFGQSKLKVKEKFETLIDYEAFLADYAWIENSVLTQFPKAFKSNTSLIFEINSTVSAAKVNLFHRTTHTMLFKLEVSKLGLIIRKLQFSLFLDILINDVVIHETMNYPHTVDSNLKHSQVVPNQIVQRRGDYTEDMVRVRFSGHDEIILANQDRTCLFILLEFQPIIALYQQQPTMRLIDYIINQIVSLIKEPEALTMNTEFIRQKKRRNTKPLIKARRAWGEVDHVQSKYICPTFLDFRIKCVRPLAVVRGWPQFKAYFQLDAEVIDVYNVQNIDATRLIKEGGMQLIQPSESWMPDGRIRTAWSEAFCIEGRNMQIQFFDGSATHSISTPINFNLSFERLLHYNEVKEIYENVEYDRSIRIRSAMSPVILKLYRQEYLEICKMIFHNFTYDDQSDKLFIHDFEVARSFEPAPISFWLDFQHISIFALSKKQDAPLISVRMEQMRLEWLRSADVELNLFGKTICMYHYDQEANKEIGFVGDLENALQLQPKGQKFGLGMDSQYFEHLYKPLAQQFSMYEFPQFDKQVDTQFTLLFHIIRPQGDKEISIVLKNVKMVVEPTVFANIGLWSRLEQPCWPPQVDFGEMPSIKLIAEILNTSLCLQAQNGNQILATKGDLSYVWNRSRFPHPEKLMKESREGKIDRNQVDQIGEVFEHKVNLKNVELFKCLYDDFVNYNLTDVHKRHIMLPFSLFFCIKNELQFDYGRHQVYFSNKFQLHVDKTICKFSYQDLVLVLSITAKLKSSKQEIIREPIYELPQPPTFIPPTNNIYDAIVSTLQVVVINDAGEAYVPVFDLTLSETQLQFQQTNSKSIFSTVLKISSTFYNPKIAIWEPIIEGCMFSLDVSLNPHGDPQKIIFLEMAQQKHILNINISAQMITVFHKTFLSWQKEIANQKKLQVEEIEEQKEPRKDTFLSMNKSNNQILIQSLADEKTENIDHVSPYTIRNESGFIIEVEDRGICKYVLKTGTSVNFQIDSEIEQVFARDDQYKQRMVQISVIHPEYQFEPIPMVDLDAIRVTRHAIKPINKDTSQTFMLFIEVVPKDTRKLLLISSETIIFNKTNQYIELKMFHLQGIEESSPIMGVVEPMRAYCVPFDRTRQYFSFRFQGAREYCKEIDLSYLQETKEKKYEQFHSEQYFTLVRCAKRNVNQTLIYLEPPFQIKNCLPLDLTFELYGDGKVDINESMLQSQSHTITETSTNLKTIIIEKAQYENLILCEKGALQKQEMRQIHSISTKGRMAVKIKLPFYNLSDMSMLHMPKLEIPFVTENIQLCDYRGNQGLILVDQIKSTFFLYTNTFAVNEMPQKVFFYSPPENKKAQPLLLSGQRFKEIPLNQDEEKSRITIIGNLQAVQVSANDTCSQLTEVINLNFTGNQTIKLHHDGYIQEVGYNLSLVCVDKQKPLVTKVLTISPKFIIINKTNSTLNILQQSQFNPLTIETGERQPFYWQDSQNQFIRIQLQEPQIEWDYSSPINPNTTGFSCFTLRAKNKLSIVKHMNCVIRADNQIIFLIILECRAPPRQVNLGTSAVPAEVKDNLVDPPYVIVNTLPLVTLICYQYCCQDQKYQEIYQFQEYKHFVNSMNQIAFSWEYPNDKRELLIQLKFEGDYSTQYSINPIFFNLEEADAAQEFVIKNQLSESEEFRFFVISTWEGSSRKLKFVQDLQLQHDERNLLKLDVNLPQVGISLIEIQGNKRVELIYALFKGVEVNIQETTEVRKSELKIKYINIDYNTTYKTMFPVIWTPTKYKEIFEYNRPHLFLVVEQSTQVNSVSLIKNVKACLQPTTIRLTSEMLEQLYAVFKQITQSFRTNIQLEESTKQFDFEYSIQQEEQEQLQQVNSAALSNKVQQMYGIGSSPLPEQVEWQTVQVSLSDKSTYINRIEIYPLKFNLTFYNTQTSNQSYNIFMQILKTIGIVLANIDEAPILLDGIYLENSFDTTSAITSKVITHYKEMFINLLLKVLGSIEFIGNPVGLFKHLAKGVYDLFDKPIEGFIKGPIEGGIGIAKGVGSLVQNTISGTFNSTSKIAGSISGGLAAISMDQKYKVEREQLKVIKPRQFVDGIALGSKMLWMGAQRAIVGVVDLPVTQTRRHGLRGTVTGVLQGSCGFFIKPFSGMFDFICKTTDGVKATAQYWDDKANDRRERDIRTMYQGEQFYKAFCERDAKLMAFLANVNIKYAQINYFESFEFGNEEHVRALVMSMQLILYLDLKKKKVIWTIDPKQVSNITYNQDGVIYQLKEFSEKLKCQQVVVMIQNNEPLQSAIVKKSRQLLKNLA